MVCSYLARIDWVNIPSSKSEQKIWLRKAVEKMGGVNALARALHCDSAAISHWRIRKHVEKGQNLMSLRMAIRIEKVTQIKGIREKLCPELLNIS